MRVPKSGQPHPEGPVPQVSPQNLLAGKRGKIFGSLGTSVSHRGLMPSYGFEVGPYWAGRFFPKRSAVARCVRLCATHPAATGAYAAARQAGALPTRVTLPTDGQTFSPPPRESDRIKNGPENRLLAPRQACCVCRKPVCEDRELATAASCANAHRRFAPDVRGSDRIARPHRGQSLARESFPSCLHLCCFID